MLVALAVEPVGTAALKNRSGSALLPGGVGEPSVSATAGCQRGEKLVSGGFDHPDHSLNAYIEPFGSFFSSHRSSRRGWSVGAKNYGNGNGTVVAYAYCARGRGIRTRSASGPVPTTGSQVGEVTAMCKPGEKVISGGFDNPDPDGRPWLIIGSHRSGRRSWTASARNASAQQGQLDVFAYCRKRGRVRTRSDTATVPHNVTAAGTAIARCKPGEKLLSGGFKGPDDELTPTGPKLSYFSSHRAGKRGWTVSAINTSSADGVLTAYAFCRP